ncbi:MAG TPA: type 1 glutamine amidotransferase [Candidatus Acetothermia bacterium]|nr:type 1 glutamine amidotransferase [Candidatus Acetothermia bacterium]
MVVDRSLSICILNAYPKESREKFDRSNVGHPHDMYRAFLSAYVPPAKVNIAFVADVDVPLLTNDEIAAYDGFIWTGSDLTIYHTDDHRVARQIELAQRIYEVGVPSYGSCWAIQMAVVAAGGEVKKNPKGREWGIARDITRTEEGKKSLLLEGKPDRYDGFIMHLDEGTELSAGATLLATNEHTHVQAVEVKHANGVFWATQYHPEYNLYEMARLIAARAEPLVNEGFFGTTDAVAQYAERMRALHDNPSSKELRAQLKVGDDIIDSTIRQQEMRNWIDYLVIPSIKR